MRPPSDKPAAILHAALGLFLKHGLRGTSMEAIARAAGAAKPTLYANYPDKQAVFRAVSEQLIGGWRDAAGAALAGQGSVASRVAAALLVREKAAMTLRLGSPHADEVFGRDGPAGPRLRDFEAGLTRNIEMELSRAGIGGPRLMAQLLVAAATGIGQHAASPAELGPALRLLCERLIRPDSAP